MDSRPSNMTSVQECLEHSLDHWEVDAEYAQHIVNYLRHGWEPGGFFSSVLANDCMGAFQRSHPLNTMDSLKKLANWIVNRCPKEACGSYTKVRDWCKLSEEVRRQHLEDAGLVPTPWQILCAKDESRA